MIMNEAKSYKTSSEWEKIIREGEQSGKSNKAYCEDQGIDLKRYWYWKNKLKKKCEKSKEILNIGNQGDISSIVPINILKPPSSGIIIKKMEYSIEIEDGTCVATIEAVIKAMESIC